MTASVRGNLASGSRAAELAEVVERLTARVRAGEHLDPERVALDYPEFADELHGLLPAIGLLADLSSSGNATAAPALVGVLGDFRIIRELGRGGMGVVYEAEQVSLRRRVALKVLPFAAVMDPRNLQRFHNEALAAAALDHPNVVKVYGVGVDRGVHHIAMQLVDGRTLADLIREGQSPAPGPTDPAATTAGVGADAAQTQPVGPASTEPARPEPGYWRRVAEWGVQAAEALEHAHALGIVHRDVKPGNLMVDGRGKLWVADFGLAQVRADPGMTGTGDVLGTPRYMSPEQASARHGLVDHRTDVYSLGATLYELLTLEPAFGGADRGELLRKVLFEDPRPPQAIRRSVPAELETIVLKAMAKDLNERYATAQEFADDLQRFLKDEPIRAKRPGVGLRTRKWARRHQPVVWSTTLAVLAVLSISVGVLVWSNREIRRQHHNEIRGKVDLELTWLVSKHELAQARHRNGTFEGVLAGTNEWLGQARRDQAYAAGGVVTLRHPGPVFGLAWSPRGQTLVTASGKAVRTWNSETGTEERRKNYPLDVMGAALSPDGRRIAVASFGLALVIDAETDAVVSSLGRHARGDSSDPINQALLSWVCHLSFHPRGHELLTAAGDGTSRCWDLAEGKERLRVDGHVAAAYSPDGDLIATIVHLPGRNVHTVVQLVSAADGREIRRLHEHAGSVGGLAFSPDGRLLASAGWDSVVRVSDVVTGRRIVSLHGHKEPLITVAFSKDGRFLASAGFEGVVRIWEAATGREIVSLNPGIGPIFRVEFSPDGDRLAAGGGVAGRGAVKIWPKTFWHPGPGKVTP